MDTVLQDGTSPRYGNISHNQEIIYDFLLAIVKRWPPEEVLMEFKRLFIYAVDIVNVEANQALYRIVHSEDEVEFRNTLKRSCYILVNNWDASRSYRWIQSLILAFDEATDDKLENAAIPRRIKQWVQHFLNSPDFEELKLFAARYDEKTQGTGPWTARYTSYLLVPQIVNLDNPVEQREAARKLAQKLKERFKFDLAMYIAKSQLNHAVAEKPKNPTVLGDEVLRLIKLIVAKRGPFSHVNLANIFLNQTRNLPYREFKESLKNYLIFSVFNQELSESLQGQLTRRFDELYPSYNEGVIQSSLLLRTCNRVVEFLTTEGEQQPSELFIMLLSQGSPIALVTVLLKLVLISPYSRTHLEACIANLIRHYQDYPEAECAWVVNFLEVFNVTFAIHAENVEYNLIRMAANKADSSRDKQHGTAQDQPMQNGNPKNGNPQNGNAFTDGPPIIPQDFDLDQYRIFSQLKLPKLSQAERHRLTHGNDETVPLEDDERESIAEIGIDPEHLGEQDF